MKFVSSKFQALDRLSEPAWPALPKNKVVQARHIQRVYLRLDLGTILDIRETI